MAREVEREVEPEEVVALAAEVEAEAKAEAEVPEMAPEREPVMAMAREPGSGWRDPGLKPEPEPEPKAAAHSAIHSHPFRLRRPLEQWQRPRPTAWWMKTTGQAATQEWQPLAAEDEDACELPETARRLEIDHARPRLLRFVDWIQSVGKCNQLVTFM